jgi:DNA helicase II / ATP-dependent DNA helicase PcrA
MAAPGPVELGRGVVVSSGIAPPNPWAGCPRLIIDQQVLREPSAALAALQQSWLEHKPLVVELAVDSKTLQERETCLLPVHDLSPRFEFAREHLHFLVWANNYDARSGEPIWWHGRKAVRSFATQGVTESGPADIELADGTPLFVDGGPFAPTRDADGIRVVHRWNTEAGSLVPVGYRPPEADLAADQLAAVSHPAGGARVIAPAGSGKTRVLTERLRYLVEERSADPSTVTVLAYNKKAADELRERCGGLVTARGPHIRTLNSVGLWICNEFGGRGRMDVLEEPRVRDLVQSVFEVRRQTNTDTVLPYIDALSAVRLGLTSPAAVEDQIPDANGLAAGFNAYREALVDAGAVDFDEQIYRAIEILLCDHAARSAAQSRSRHLLVDEFQDLNPAHMLLIRLLSAPTYNTFGVGDDDQVIYGYAGATPEYLINFEEYFAGARDYALGVNYRCPPAVVTAAKHVLSYNSARVAKTITTPAGSSDALPEFGGPLHEQGPVAVVHADAELLAQSAVAAVSAWRDAGITPNEIAVLSRVNSTLLPVQVALSEAGIPSNAPLSADVLKRTGIATTLAYLRMGLSPDAIRREDVAQTIRRPSRGIAPNVTKMLSERATTSVQDIRRLARRLSGRDVSKLSDYADSIDSVADACRASSAAAVRAVRADVGLGETMDVLDSSRREADRSTHADDLLALESLAALHPDVASFESWLRAALGRRPPEGPSVHLSTVHKIKGREWEHVIVYGASKGLFPHRLSDDEEGERRVFHVALTRAIRQVLVLADTQEPSPFVAELHGSRAHTPVLRARREGRDAAGLPGGRSTTVTSGLRGQSEPRRRGSRATPPLPRRTSPVVTAEIGLVLEHGGHSGTVVDLTESAVVVEVGSARLRVPFGSEVRVQAATVQLVSPAEGSEPSGPDEKFVSALREWRSGAAKLASVPAYVVLNDAELVGIATSRPTTLAELSRCKGVGPIRLERWGDELLAALDGADGNEASNEAQ